MTLREEVAEVPKFNRNPYLEGKYEIDSEGKVVYHTIVIPIGYFIGPGTRSYKPSHPNKKPEYYRRKNTPKSDRKAA